MGSHGDGSVGWDDVLGRDVLWRCSGSVWTVPDACCHSFQGGGGTALALQWFSLPFVQLWFYGAKRCPCCEQQFSAWRGWLQGSFSKGGRGSSGWKESKKPDPPHRAERSFISVGSSLRGSSQIIYFGPNEKHVSSAESHNQRKMLRVHAGSCLGHAAPHSAGWGQGDTLPAG